MTNYEKIMGYTPYDLAEFLCDVCSTSGDEIVTEICRKCELREECYSNANCPYKDIDFYRKWLESEVTYEE